MGPPNAAGQAQCVGRVALPWQWLGYVSARPIVWLLVSPAELSLCGAAGTMAFVNSQAIARGSCSDEAVAPACAARVLASSRERARLVAGGRPLRRRRNHAWDRRQCGCLPGRRSSASLRSPRGGWAGLSAGDSGGGGPGCARRLRRLTRTRTCCQTSRGCTRPPTSSRRSRRCARTAEAAAAAALPDVAWTRLDR
jgi:hypothetical protein